MDKYEFNIKLEQIKKLAAKKEYMQAAAIAKEMNWNKVKDWPTLATIINVQEAAGDYEEARDMAILAYNRNLGGRKLIYKLTEFFIKVEDFENAEELYREYAKMAAHDVNRYILYYDLRKAQGAPNEELVSILEEYKESEIDEKYMCELAELYYKVGRNEDCIKTCDNLVLWFQDGVYVERAVKLKEKLGVDMTHTQKKILKEIHARKTDEEANKEKLFMEQKELAKIKKDEVGDVLDEDEKNQNTTSKSKKNRNKSKQKHNTKVSTVEPSVNSSDKLEVPVIKKPENPVQEIKEPVDNEVKAEEVLSENIENTESGTTSDFSENVNKASLSLKELIENAKKKIENNCEQLTREDEEEARLEAQRRMDEKADAMDIEVKVPNYNMYDTRNLQDELAKSVEHFFKDEDETTFKPQQFERIKGTGIAKQENIDAIQAEAEQSSKTKPVGSVQNKPKAEQPQPVENTEDEQIEGQLSIADWMETVREKKYGNQDTIEFSKVELERMLDERNEKSEAYERIMAKKKAEALSSGDEFDEAQAKRATEAEVAIDSAKRDLSMRTGKAAFILEQQTAKEISEERAEQIVEVTLNTTNIEPVTEQMLKAYSKDGESIGADKEAYANAYNQSAATDSTEFFKAETNNAQLPEEDAEEKKLSGELAKIFRKYREMPGLESQLVDLFDSLDEEMQMNTSSCGNILISGNSSSDKTDLARTIVRALNYVYSDRPKKIAKTSGESINQRGISKAMGKLKGTALIVEGAGTIQPKRINEILTCLNEDTDRMIVIFEDSDAEMNVLLNFNPELSKTFNHRISLKQYTVNELVEMAKRFARKRQYEVDDDALLELYLKIDKLHGVKDNIKLDDIKEVINQAIANSEKRASRKFFGGLKKKRGENGDVIFLTEADFKD